MRTMKTKLGGRAVVLTASFAASIRIAQEVADPLLISREIVKEAMFSQQGINYKPLWEMNVESAALILQIGMQATDAEVSEDAVNELVFDEGLLNSQNIALEYLALIVEPKSQEIIKKAAQAEKGKTPRKRSAGKK